MNKILLIAFLSLQLLTLPATAQIAPNEAMKSSGKSEIIVAQALPPKLPPKLPPPLIPVPLPPDDAYKERIIKLEALVEKQDELIEALKSELKKCKEAKDGKKY